MTATYVVPVQMIWTDPTGSLAGVSAAVGCASTGAPFASKRRIASRTRVIDELVSVQ